MSSFDLIHEYLNEFNGNMICLMHTPGMPAAMDTSRLPRGQIHGRFDVHRATMGGPLKHGKVVIVTRMFKSWISSRGYDYGSVIKDILTAGYDATPPRGRMVLSKGTSLKLGQQYVFGIDLANGDFQGYLDDIQQTIRP
jgi:hypothetical protein